MTGKQKCRILKEIRRQIAEQNDIRFVIEECTHKGKCRGTCPKCEWEVRMLERELEKRRASGKKIALAGISAGFLLTSCSPIDTVKEIVSSVADPLEGDLPAETTSGAIAETEMPEYTVTEGEPAWEHETELGEVEPPETIEVDGMIPLAEETEEELPEIEDELLPVDPVEEELILEGDIWYPAPDEEEMS